MTRWTRLFRLSLVLPLFLSNGNLRGSPQTFDEIRNKVSEHTLANGMKWIVLERHNAPVAAFHIYADVGSANESYGITGISHLIEHLAFSGTKVVGTKDYSKESVLLDQLDAIVAQIELENANSNPDRAKLAELQKLYVQKRREVEQFFVTREFYDMFLKEGDRNLGAFTNSDATQYQNALPSNRLEFWMAMNADRFMNPVFREFFKEREVVMEERRIRIESSPGVVIDGKLREDFAAAAFKAHPYHHDVLGHMSDLQRITRQDVKDYFKKYYGPSNLTVAIVGDVKTDEVFRLAELYFGRIPSRPRPEAVRTQEPEQWGERRVQVSARAEPLLLVGYHRPGINDKDRFVFEAISSVLGHGQSSRLFQIMVKQKKVAVDTGSFNGWPGEKFPNLCVFYAVPSPGHTSAECLRILDAETERLKLEPIAVDDLAKYRNVTKKRLIDSMKSNSQMAAMLTRAEALLGGWQHMFDEIQGVQAVTAADIQRVAKTYLVRKNRTIGEVTPEEGEQ